MLSPEKEAFYFKKFKIIQSASAMKVNTDGVLLGAWVKAPEKGKVLDIGTGTGVIAIMIAQQNTDCVIDGVEIDDNSCKEAERNMSESPWSSRLNCFHHSIQDFGSMTENTYDLIVSNPPFYSGGTFSGTQQRNLVKHTTKLAHSDLLFSVKKLLNKKGKFCVILPLIEGMRFIEIAEQYGMFCSDKVYVRPKANKAINRLILCFSKTKQEINESNLCIREESNEFTTEYMKLTKDFYLKF